ncbi:DNA methyltransferase [Thermus scotoductus]|uniref:DNA methyltransferase n=1 Tax=Thermus scotoductus TaxID=37636 RepID=A0A430R0C0_THESC|nr:DNA adenine methylase [Thermus scotoductus]RTG93477.1 DNA methyltransferase [Thermus scotoductus]RTH00842.1 DNA methyltransferase [Thermus scotoductus]RTH06770.1 DNA methyltransferase [Thermus scotoductus]RTH08715.1 DNA methyltransferase [Thermus scotoductus]RTH16264.1 DNA methyltransferase [Thermus scotoductus]
MVARSVLRYPGGKWRLAPWIIRHFPHHDAYVEPFGGSAAVLLQKAPSPLEVWNDLGGEVYNFFLVLRDEGLCARLVRALELTPWHRLEYERCLQGLGEPQDDPVERARRFFVASWQGVWGGSWRYVRSGSRFAITPSEAWGPFEHLLAASQRLRRVQFEHRDAFAVMKEYDAPESLFYLDPPYLASTRAQPGAQYEVDTATEAWHRELLETVLSLRGMVVLSGYPSPLYEEVLERRGWVRVEILARGNAMRRKDRVEALWLSPVVVRANGRLL